MIWQGAFDESEQHGLFVLAGYIASVDRWAAFSEQWAGMARRFGRVDARGRYYIHMSEQAKEIEEDCLIHLRTIIAETVLAGFAIAVRPSDFRAATRRIVVLKNGRILPVTGSLIRNYYLFSFEYFINSLSQKATDRKDRMEDIDLKSDRIDLIFDERTEKGIIVRAWDDIKKQPRMIDVPISQPRFEDDKEFLPLQAADFFAYWITQGLREIREPQEIYRIRTFPFGNPPTPDRRIWQNVLFLTQEEIVEWMKSAQIEGVKIVDSDTFAKSSG